MLLKNIFLLCDHFYHCDMHCQFMAQMKIQILHLIKNSCIESANKDTFLLCHFGFYAISLWISYFCSLMLNRRHIEGVISLSLTSWLLFGPILPLSLSQTEA